jgi:hypothetical protein
MRHATICVTLALTMTVAAACGGNGEPDPQEAPAGETVISVPDSTIEREIRSRLDADPRLDGEGIDLRVTSAGGTVMLAGEVPTRMEMSIAREVAMSAPGVVTVSFDSLVVLSERSNAAADTLEVQ